MKELRKQINLTLKGKGLSIGKTEKKHIQGTNKNQYGSYKVVFQQKTDGYKLEKNHNGFTIHPISQDWKKRMEILDFIFDSLKEVFNVEKTECAVVISK